MIDQINNFAGFNLAAILFGVVGGGVCIIIFHYLLMPILTLILVKPLSAVIVNTWEFFNRGKKTNNLSADQSSNKKNIENFIDWFSNFFIIKAILFLYIPFVSIIYIFEAKEKNIELTKFNEEFVIEILFGSLIFVSVVLAVSIIAKLAKIEFKKAFPMIFIFLFFLGFIQYFK